MFSFCKIAVFATLTLGVFTVAKPFARETSVQGAEAILTTLKDTITPLAAQLGAVKSSEATPAVVGPIVDKITAAISTANTGAKALVGQSQDVVLSSATSNERVPLKNISKLVTDILTLLIPVLVRLARIVGPGAALIDVLRPVGLGLSALLGSLVLAVAGLINLLIPVVQGLLAGISGLVTVLGLGGLLIALGL
ncbi:hypothetical protein HWV62_5873 [Athelia sp. TMB]|nr:hypothetical protein HWV62_5873 [Athelia sp. TMB]